MDGSQVRQDRIPEYDLYSNVQPQQPSVSQSEVSPLEFDFESSLDDGFFDPAQPFANYDWVNDLLGVYNYGLGQADFEAPNDNNLPPQIPYGHGQAFGNALNQQSQAGPSLYDPNLAMRGGAAAIYHSSASPISEETESRTASPQEPSKNILQEGASPQSDVSDDEKEANDTDEDGDEYEADDDEDEDEDETSDEEGSQLDDDDDDHKKEWVDKIVSAIRDMSQYNDRPQANGKPAVAVTFVNKVPNSTLREAARDLYDGCKHRQAGHYNVAKAHGTRKREDYDSLEDRLRALIKVCEKEKAPCKSAIEPLFIQRLCDAPAFEQKRIGSNRKLNKRRNHQVQTAIAAKNAGYTLDILVEQAVRKAEKEDEPAGDSKTASSVTKSKAQKSKKRKTAPESDDDDAEPAAASKTKKLRKIKPSKKIAQTKPAKDVKKSVQQALTPASPSATQSPAATLDASETTSNQHVATLDLTTYSSRLEESYKIVVCNVLGVVTEFKCMSLHILRTYARAYNEDLAGSWWFSFELPGTHGLQTEVTSFATKEKKHLALCRPEFMHLAIGRGDFLATGDMNTSPERNKKISANSDLERKALGMIDNPCGLFMPVVVNI